MTEEGEQDLDAEKLKAEVALLKAQTHKEKEEELFLRAQKAKELFERKWWGLTKTMGFFAGAAAGLGLMFAINGQLETSRKDTHDKAVEEAKAVGKQAQKEAAVTEFEAAVTAMKAEATEIEAELAKAIASKAMQKVQDDRDILVAEAKELNATIEESEAANKKLLESVAQSERHHANDTKATIHMRSATVEIKAAAEKAAASYKVIGNRVRMVAQPKPRCYSKYAYGGWHRNTNHGSKNACRAFCDSAVGCSQWRWQANTPSR